MTSLVLIWWLVVNGTPLVSFPTVQSCLVAKANVQAMNPVTVLVACVPEEVRR
jgi:hypothetical protein